MNTRHNNIFNNLQNHQLNIKKYTKENVFRFHQFDTISLKLSKRNDGVYSKEYAAVLERFLHLDLECLPGRSLFQDLAGGSWREKKSKGGDEGRDKKENGKVRSPP